MTTSLPVRKSFRGWSLLLAVLMTLACMPTAVWAADDTEPSGGGSDNTNTQVGVTIAVVLVAVFVWIGLRSDFGRDHGRHRPDDGTQIALRNSRPTRPPVYLDFSAPEPSSSARPLTLAEPERMDMAARVGLRIHF